MKPDMQICMKICLTVAGIGRIIIQALNWRSNHDNQAAQIEIGIGLNWQDRQGATFTQALRPFEEAA
jgi:hypothetical protein